MLVDLSTNTPNGHHSQSPMSPGAHTIKQEEGLDDEVDRRNAGMEEMQIPSGQEVTRSDDPMSDSPSNLQDVTPAMDGPSDAGIRLPNGDRPFQCNQCGVSFTQKGNLLRHIKLHTGEKPFKCPFCSYACRRRDALTGHLRTHSVGKPHKCNYCGRSYKQRASLEEHKERCHSYLQSVGMDAANIGHYSGEASKEHRPPMEPANIAFDRPPVIERLQANVGKRKSTTPQKFVGEKVMRYSYPDMNYEVGLKEAEMVQSHVMDQVINNAIAFMSPEPLRPMVPHPPFSVADVVPMVNPLFHPVYSLGPRMERPSSQEAPTLPFPPPEIPPSSNNPVSLVRPKNAKNASPCNSGQDSADSARSSPRETLTSQGSARPRSRASPGFNRGEEGERGRVSSGGDTGTMRPGTGEAVRVLSREGHELRAFQCDHCRMLFLDHVMYTIHMGCHGYRDPLECNICGHCSKDRYEFSSHIVRGEHTFH
ncbi:zinc finger protein Helios isoform X2 [Denticeps clupeoides]|nr:zinc finger protein Helios isoform X2 [Denticeps clupeoides]